MLNQLGGCVPNLGAQPVPSDAVSSTPLKPLNGHVFVKPDEPIQKVGALFVPPAAGGQCSGTVIASSSSMVNAGDRVVYSGFWPFDFDGKTHIACMEKHLVGVLPAALPGVER